MIMERIEEAEAGFRSLSEAIDTTTAPGRMMMQMVGAFAEFERAILRERTKSGLDAARKQGRIGGRRPKLRPNQQDEIVAMVSAGTKTAADAARLFGHRLISGEIHHVVSSLYLPVAKFDQCRVQLLPKKWRHVWFRKYWT
jgi:DNA invertase Pin-like site-specific DNA recombinase